MKLKKELIGGTQFVKILNSHVVINEDNRELFLNLGLHELFQDDTIVPKGNIKHSSANVKRVIGRKSTR